MSCSKRRQGGNGSGSLSVWNVKGGRRGHLGGWVIVGVWIIGDSETADTALTGGGEP